MINRILSPVHMDRFAHVSTYLHICIFAYFLASSDENNQISIRIFYEKEIQVLRVTC